MIKNRVFRKLARRNPVQFGSIKWWKQSARIGELFSFPPFFHNIVSGGY